MHLGALPVLKIMYTNTIGAFRNSQSDVISVHAHIRGRQRYGQLYGICVKCGFIFREKWAFIANVILTLACIL